VPAAARDWRRRASSAHRSSIRRRSLSTPGAAAAVENSRPTTLTDSRVRAAQDPDFSNSCSTVSWRLCGTHAAASLTPGSSRQLVPSFTSHTCCSSASTHRADEERIAIGPFIDHPHESRTTRRPGGEAPDTARRPPRSAIRAGSPGRAYGAPARPRARARDARGRSRRPVRGGASHAIRSKLAQSLRCRFSSTSSRGRSAVSASSASAISRRIRSRVTPGIGGWGASRCSALAAPGICCSQVGAYLLDTDRMCTASASRQRRPTASNTSR